MIRVFRMELYRVLRSVSTWILIVIYFGIYLFAGGLMGILLGDSGLSQSFQQELFGSTVEAVTDFAELFNACMMGNMVVLITSVFMGMHATAHSVTGFQKNLAGCTRPWHFAVSNAFILLLFHAVLILVGMLALRLVTFLTHATVSLASPSGLLRYCLVYLLLVTAFGMFASLTADVTRSRVAAIAVPVVYCTVGSKLLYQLVNYCAAGLPGASDFRIEAYVPYGLITTLPADADPPICIRAAISAVIFTLLCMAVSIYVRRKQDIR